VDTVEDAAAAVPALVKLDRRQVRAVFEKRFSVARMARDYLAAYARLIGAHAAKAS
ncbi:glycosyltransferase family 4 protein, partial [Mesorhizobium sp. M2E.F.Ca.ET.154.01.1.1]